MPDARYGSIRKTELVIAEPVCWRAMKIDHLNEVLRVQN